MDNQEFYVQMLGFVPGILAIKGKEWWFYNI